ncbi:BnaC06g12090D [Brassica napus]|uniref:BnaC06g12090D protein n=2 Tax=Brassica napus TaxID=3708 RepID=A0A078GQS5_BRANA|nr:BnaC06g12090D [Brassica napus]
MAARRLVTRTMEGEPGKEKRGRGCESC